MKQMGRKLMGLAMSLDCCWQCLLPGTAKAEKRTANGARRGWI